MGAWVQEQGWEETGETHLPAEARKVWGKAPNAVPLVEEEIRMLHSHRTWQPHVMSTWLDWWSANHPDTPAGAWVASVGTLHVAFKDNKGGNGQSIKSEKVRRSGPTHITRSRASHFWFPLHDIKHGWGLILADINQRQLSTWGRVPLQISDRAKLWMNTWLAEGRVDEEKEWTVTEKGTSWQPGDDVTGALQMAEWMLLGDAMESEWEDSVLEWASRLLPHVCRDYGKEQDRRQEGTENPPAKPAPPPANKHDVQRARRAANPKVAKTRSNMAWTQVRAEAIRQKPRPKQVSVEEQEAVDWKRKWSVTRADRTDPTCYVVTVNVGPRGLQVCVDNLPELIKQHKTLPMVIHLQDIRITGRRFKTIQDLLRKVLPDYTAYANIRKCGKARRYQMGVMTLLRNDVAYTAERIPLGQVDMGEMQVEKATAAAIKQSAGRVLVLKTTPPGAPGAVYHVNVYQHTSSAVSAMRKGGWDVCSGVIRAAQAEGAAVVLGGDLNATTLVGQLAAKDKSVDRACRSWIREHKGAAAVSSRDDNRAGQRSWQDPQGRRDADLDHVIVFPATIPMSHRRLLSKLEPGLDHLPVSVAFQTASLGAHVNISQQAAHHQPRLKTADYAEQEPALRQAFKEWEETRKPLEQGEVEEEALYSALNVAKQVFGQVSGWTKQPNPHRKRVLPGHQPALRELDALFVSRRLVQQSVDLSAREGVAAWPEGQLQQRQKWVLRGKKMLGDTLPGVGVQRSAEFWKIMLTTVRDAIVARQRQMRMDTDTDQKERLKKALARLQGDFGRKRRTYKAALLRNPPSIPLLGVLSGHPNTITFLNLLMQQVIQSLNGLDLRGSYEIEEGDKVKVKCIRHDDVARIVLRAPVGECKVSNFKATRLVADEDNKLSGIEHFFGTNALGAHPRCTKHMSPSTPRQLRCISEARSCGTRHVHWFCNDCAAPCEVQAPELVPAKTFLPTEVFDGHNTIPEAYDTRMKEPLTDSDLSYVLKCLPRRRAPGPDRIPNELLRLLPPSVVTMMKNVLNDALVRGIFPPWWKDVSVTLMTKNAPGENMANQRPVALCNTVYKVFSIVINSRLTRAVEENAIIEPEQAGGRRHRGCTRPLQWLQWNLHDAQRRNKKLYALWIDTKNAFGSVSHQVIWSILRGYGFKDEEVDFLQAINANNRFDVSGPFGVTAAIHTHAGVGQGDITSPLLWNLEINAMLRYIHGARVGYTHESGVMTSAQAYIDDCCFLSDTDGGLKEQVRRLNEFYQWSGLSINNSKCAIFAHDFATGGNLGTSHIRINGEALPQYDQHRTYKYLGMQVAAGGSWAREKARVRRDTAECIRALRGSVYSPRQLDQVVRSCIIPIFRYGAGLVDWTDTELDAMTAMWATAQRMAWKLAPGTPHCLHTLHRLDGGGGILHAKVIWAKEMTGLWSACRKFDDELRQIATWEWNHSVNWVGCHNDREAGRELVGAHHPTKITDLSNRYRRVCAQLGTKVAWKHTNNPQQSSPGDTQTLMTATRQVRDNDTILAESSMQEKRIWLTSTQQQGQQVLQVVPTSGVSSITRAIPGDTLPVRVVADRIPRIAGVSDPQPDASSFLCHFQPHRHPREEWFPEQWRDDWESACYLVRAAAILTV